jgi:molybdopterin converting factor small subunit
VLCFASARDAVGAASTGLELGAEATVADALALLAELHPALRSLLPALRVAMDEEFVTGATALQDGATIALLPPVSGG